MPTKSITERKEALRVVLGAKKVLRKRGWFGGTGNYRGDSCALMALNEAATEGLEQSNDWNHQNELAACMVLDEANRIHRDDGDSKYDTIPEWNDTWDRTQRQVTGVFTRVAKKLYSSLPPAHRKGIKI